MTKLVYGKDKQVVFQSEAEKQEAFDYLSTSPDVEFRVEENQESGAWGREKRIHFHSDVGVPDGLRRNFTAGRGGLVARINCAELYDEILPLRRK